MTIQGMRIAYWIPKTTNTFLECVTLIAFTLQRWSPERISSLPCTYIDCLVIFIRNTEVKSMGFTMSFCSWCTHLCLVPSLRMSGTITLRPLYQCFSTAGPRPGTGPWHQLHRAARGSPGICHFSFLSISSRINIL